MYIFTNLNNTETLIILKINLQISNTYGKKLTVFTRCRSRFFLNTICHYVVFHKLYRIL